MRIIVHQCMECTYCDHICYKKPSCKSNGIQHFIIFNLNFGNCGHGEKFSKRKLKYSAFERHFFSSHAYRVQEFKTLTQETMGGGGVCLSRTELGIIIILHDMYKISFLEPKKKTKFREE